ncbi:MAG: DUF6249 domain-containing protein [Crocinitomicaceae bacterium]
MYQAAEIIIPIASMAMVFGIVYLGVTGHYRKQMAMIEAGMNPSKKRKESHSRIRTACLLVLVPTGILIGNLVGPHIHSMELAEAGLLFGFLFGGVALVASYFLERKFEPVTEED